jgi:hypothetical protein
VRVRLSDSAARVVLLLRHGAARLHLAALAVLPIVPGLGGCGRLMFEAGDDPLTTCPAPCIASAAASFDGTIDGADNRWRYVGDRRDHTWAPMAVAAGAMVGELDNRIERCADQPQADACLALPGALLVTSSGMSSTSDPAIEYLPPEARVVQLALRVHVPAGGVEHRVRLYRNSREDVLFTTSVSPGTTAAHAITLDALPGDRWVVALEARASSGSATALHLFVSDAGQAFPSSCQLAVGFSDADIIGPAVDDLCGGALTSVTGTQPTAPSLIDGPFAYHGTGLYLEPGLYVHGSRPLARSDSTIQFWIRPEGTQVFRASVFSDIDETTARGLAVELDRSTGLEAAVVTATNPVAYTRQRIAFAPGATWRFVRVVHAAGVVAFCVDGAHIASLPLPSSGGVGSLPHLGRNGPWNPSNELLASLDDVRVFSTALPCE